MNDQMALVRLIRTAHAQLSSRMDNPNKRIFAFSFTTALLFSSFFCGKCQESFDIENTYSLLDEKDDDDDAFTIVQNKLSSQETCDLSIGNWVYDKSYPLYSSTCPYLSSPVTCQKNGRPDSDYEKLKWKPHGCSIPRFDALDFLGKMRRKRIVLVGDSIMRNQWESLVCLVQSVLPTSRKTVIYNGPTMAFHALDFETSIDFCWAPLLVELKKAPGKKRVLHLDLIEENARFWRGADVLVFDSAHWWTHSEKQRSWDYVREGGKVYQNLNPMVAYEKGLTTWAKWVDLNLDPRRTHVIFRSMSPSHNRESGWKCYNQTEPLRFASHLHVPQQMRILQGVLKRLSFPISLHDISTMSFLRRDGHPSIYSREMNQEEKQNLKNYSSDCSHWCLPGVPDTWNEMLSAML